MKARYTLEDGSVIEQNFDDLVDEAEEKGYGSEGDLMDYLQDCYVADESDFQGTFTQWLDALQEDYFH